MKNTLATLLLCVLWASAHAGLENPQPNSVQSGIGLISGWTCGPATISYTMDGGPQIGIPFGGNRADTGPVCGGRITNGYGLLVNFSELSNGSHTIRLYKSGVLQETVTFTTVNVGGEFITGLRGLYYLNDFPSSGKRTLVEWQETKQNFSIIAVENSVTGPPTFPANISPIGPPPYTCVAPGVATQSVMQKLNAFWQSNMKACVCDPVALSSGCRRNAFVSASGYGYIFFDKSFLDEIDTTSGSTLPADAVMAHEVGHNIQLRFGLNPPGKYKELQADCLAGFYVGYQVRTGQVSQTDVINTFQFACSQGDPNLSPWWQPGAHGTCGERVNAMQQGVSGYLGNALPLNACPG